MSEPEIPKFMSEDETWYCEAYLTRVYYHKIYDAWSYYHYRLVIPRLRQKGLYPFPNTMSVKERIRLCQQTITELKNESEDGCFETPSWLENKSTEPTLHKNQKYTVDYGVKCPRCSSDNIRSKGKHGYRCRNCGRYFPKQPKYELR